jgi:hypothetical protein
MRIQEHRTYSRESWASLVEICDGNPLHLPQVHLADQSDADQRFLVFYEDDSPLACGIGFSLSGSHRFFRRRESIFLLPTAPAVKQDAASSIVYDSLLRHCLDGGYDRLFIGHTWGNCFQGLRPYSHHITETVVEFVIDLIPGLEDVLAGMHKAHRKNIRRAKRNGLEVRIDNSLEGLLELRRLQQVSANRAKARGHGFSIRDTRYFRNVQEQVYGPGIGEVFLAFLDGECVGAMAYLKLGRKGITVRSGCSAKGYETYAMYLLQFAVLQSAQEKSLFELNIGGVPEEAQSEDHPQHGLYEFKKGFGGSQHRRDSVSMEMEWVR